MAVGSETQTDPVADAVAAVVQLAQRERELATEWQLATAQLRSQELAAGQQLAAGTAAKGALAKVVSQKRAEADVLEQGARAAHTMRRAAIPAITQARSAELRSRASAKRAEADQREPKTRKLLQTLQEHEGVEYVPAQPTMPSRPMHFGPDAPHLGGSFLVGVINLSKTALLRDEAGGMEHSADAIARQPVVDSGSIEVVGRAAVIDALFADPTLLGPCAVDVLAWLDDAETAEQKRRERTAAHGTHATSYVPPDAPMGFRLVWARGVIDGQRSGTNTAITDQD